MADKTFRVRCSFEIDVRVPADMSDEDARFAIEDNGCPGTGHVGGALKSHMEQHEASGTCWACALNGTNTILPSGSGHEGQ